MADIRFFKSRLALVPSLALSVGLLVGGCSSSGGEDDDDGGGTDTPAAGTPTPQAEWDGVLSFDGISEGDSIALNPTTLTAPVNFTVTTLTEDVKFAAPGTCSGSHQCVHVHLNIDGSAGNISPNPYNNAGYTSPLTADFTPFGDDAAGAHTITLQVVYDDHTPVASAGGKAEVGITTRVNEADPQIIVSSPAPGTTHYLESDGALEVVATVTNFEIADEGSCSSDNCGHFVVLVDNTACGDPNNEGAGTSVVIDNAPEGSESFAIDALLNDCPDVNGVHNITVQLVDDNGSQLEPPAFASVRVTTFEEGTPQIEITGPVPEPGTPITLGDDAYESIPIEFTVKNFTLKAPGACGSVSNTCGHVHLNIDGEDGNDASTGAPYNNAGAASPLNARFYWLDYNEFSAVGAHTVSLSLHKDDHSDVLVGDVLIEDTLALTTAANDNPSITIVRPAPGDTVRMGTDANKTVSVTFTVPETFTLAAPGSCGANADCGHVHANIDGDECNESGTPYNNAAFASPMDIFFAKCPTAVGTHKIELSLHKDDHSLITIKTGDFTAPAADWATVTTQEGGGGGGGGGGGKTSN